jgi:hypothetical protein
MRRARTTYKGRTLLGEDLMKIDVGDKIEVRRFGSDSCIDPRPAQQRAAADHQPATRAAGG